jgi:hypothetical protein
MLFFFQILLLIERCLAVVELPREIMEKIAKLELVA